MAWVGHSFDLQVDDDRGREVSYRCSCGWRRPPVGDARDVWLRHLIRVNARFRHDSTDDAAIRQDYEDDTKRATCQCGWAGPKTATHPGWQDTLWGQIFRHERAAREFEQSGRPYSIVTALGQDSSGRTDASKVIAFALGLALIVLTMACLATAG